MIYLYSGTPGSGKSLHASQVMFDWLTKSRKNVIANFEINRDFILYSNVKRKKKRFLKPGKFFYFSDDVINFDLLLDYARKHHKPRKEAQTLLVLDECSADGLFNNRTWQNQSRSDWITFFRQHRKLGFDIVLISQSDRLIDKAIRAFVEYEVKHRKANNYKLLGRILGLLGGGSTFFAVTYWYGIREKTGMTMFRFKRKFANLYDTFKVF